VSVGIKPFVPQRYEHEDRATALIPGLQRLSQAAQVVDDEGGGEGRGGVPSMADGNVIDGLSHIYVVKILRSQCPKEKENKQMNETR
jgi:hypothetical protein